ncbi:hypothetical protein HDU76_010407 [Blyttiomyces sp. JEL0837]|nr:hypothetical protein HDU76_010407 [Blyttiomyces sp. JEL0837]
MPESTNLTQCVCCSHTSNPYNVPAPFDGAVRRILTDLKEELGSSLAGALLTGSVATGEIHVNSDIDIFVIINEPKRQRRLFNITPDQFIPPLIQKDTASPTAVSNGIPKSKQPPSIAPLPITHIQSEVFLNPSSRILTEITSLEDPTVQAWRLGHVLIDDEKGTVQSIRDRALQTHATRKPGCESWTRFRVASTRYALLDILHDTWDTIEAGDAASGSAMLMKGLSAALDVLYDSRGWWCVKEKRRLRDLAAKRESGDDAARRVLPLAKRISRGDLESVERHKSLKQLVDVVLEPMGGIMTEWVTEWEPVDLVTGEVLNSA